MDEQQTTRLEALRLKFDNEGPASLSQQEGEEFVRLMRLEGTAFAKAKSSKRAAASGGKKEAKLAPPPSAADFAAKLKAIKERMAGGKV
jgi:hypothetical protein